MAGTALSTFRTISKQYADRENSQFISDAEWTTYVNMGYRRLYNELLQLHEDYYLKSQNIPLVVNQEDYTLASDFFKLKGVDLLPGGDTTFPISLFPFQWEERNRFRYYQVLIQPLYASIYRYRLMGSSPQTLKILPIPTAGGVNSDIIRVWYIPDLTLLVNDTDTVITETLFDEYITLYAAILAFQKEESVPDSLTARFADARAMVIKTASSRRVDQARRIAAVQNDYEGLATGYVGGYGIGMGGGDLF